MDRISALGYVRNAQGNRVFADENLAGGVDGTDVDQVWLTGMQEEVAGTIEAAGLALDPANNTLLRQAIPLLVHGAMISRRWFTQAGPGQYTRSSPAVKGLRVYLQAAGGSSAGAPATQANQVSAGGAGGGGGYAELEIADPAETIPLFIGTGGMPQVGGNGLSGGGTMFAGVTVGGGLGGSVAGPSGVTTIYAGGGNGGAPAPTGAAILRNTVPGNPGQGTQVTLGQGIPGLGGAYLLLGYGAGAIGTANGSANPAVPGVQGGGGGIVVEEYS